MNRSVRFALGGLETGVTGALAMLTWLGFASLLLRRTIWWIPNIFASSFYGERTLLHQVTRYTASGVALEIAIYGFIGCLFGLAWRDNPGGGRLLWTGLAVGLAVWYLLFRVAWQDLRPTLNLHAVDRQILIGNMLYGFMLTRYPKFASRLVAGPYAPPAAQG